MSRCSCWKVSLYIAFGHSGPAADGLARDDEAAEVFQETPELRVAGRVGDAAMEGKILIDAVRAAPDRRADGVEAVDDLADLRGRGAFGRQPRGLDLDPGAQLHHLEHCAQRRQPVERDPQRRAGILRDKGADALTRDHEPVRAQGSDRFPHHRAAHAGGRDHFLLGRQARSRRDLAAGDVVGQPDHQLAGQGSPRRQRLRHRKARRRPGHHLDTLGRSVII